MEIIESLPDGFSVFRWGDAELLLELPGEVVHCGVLQRRGDFGKVHGGLTDHLLAFLKLDAADILAGSDLQMLVKQLPHLEQV